MAPEGEPVAAAIDGRDGKSWHLPLPPLSATSLEPHAPGEAWLCMRLASLPAVG